MLQRSRQNLGPHFSEGARLLWLLMLEKGWSIRQLREAVGAGGGVVNRWLYGDGRPRGVFLAQIERAFGIAPARWYEPPTEAFSPPVAAA